MITFKALIVEEQLEEVRTAVKTCTLNDLSEGETLIKVSYSGMNYKDALATKKKGGVIRSYPMIPGIDAVGEIMETTATDFQPGDKVIITGNALGVSHTGGFSEVIRVPNEWLVTLPETVAERTAGIIGTAGITAIQSIIQLEKHGLADKEARILVTGATGGVGSIGIAFLNSLGYKNITALSRKKNEAHLLSLGATQVIALADFIPETIKPLQKQAYDFVIDTVGGEVLGAVLPQVQYGGAVTTCGNASGINLNTTVLPFILRGITLVGIDSVQLSNEEKEIIWQRVGADLDQKLLETILSEEITLEEVAVVVGKILEGTHSGRTLIKL